MTDEIDLDLTRLENLFNQVQHENEQQRLLNEAEQLIRQTERFLSRPANEQSRSIVEEILRDLEDRSAKADPSIDKRIGKLKNEAEQWKQEAAPTTATTTAAKDAEGVSDLRRIQERGYALPLQPLHQDERVYAEITPPREPVRHGERAKFSLVLHAPDRVLPTESCFALVAWPAGKPYSHEAAAILGQAFRKPEAATEVDVSAPPAAAPVQGEAAQTSETGTQDAPQTGTGEPPQEDTQVSGQEGNGQEAATAPEPPPVKATEQDGWATHLCVEAPSLDLPPGRYWLALAYNDAPLPGPRATLEVVLPTDVPETTVATQEEPETPKARAARVDWGNLVQVVERALPLINTLALVLIALSLLSLPGHLPPISTPTLTPTATVSPPIPTATWTPTTSTIVSPSPTASPIVSPIVTPSPSPTVTATLSISMGQLISVTLSTSPTKDGKVLALAGQPITITFAPLTTTMPTGISGTLSWIDSPTGTPRLLSSQFISSADLPITFTTPGEYSHLRVIWEPDKASSSETYSWTLSQVKAISSTYVVTGSRRLCYEWRSDLQGIKATLDPDTVVQLQGKGTIPSWLLVNAQYQGKAIDGWMDVTNLQGYDEDIQPLLPTKPQDAVKPP